MNHLISQGNLLKTEKKIEAGKEIDSRCLKCKDVTNHTIIAMAAGKVAKVQCNVCGGRHNYRPPTAVKKATPKKKSTRPTAASIRQAKAEALYEELLASRDPSKTLSYSMTDTFRRGDMIDHPMFGLGVVIETIMPDKIEVLFREDTKLLICGELPFRR